MEFQQHDLVALSQQLADSFRQQLGKMHISSTEIADDALLTTYLPICQWLVQRTTAQPHFVGINGAQGSGKSTLCQILARLLEEGFGKKVAILSIDDLYLTRAERQQLAATTHPLLITRGVPGTHDITLGKQLFQQLRQQTGQLSLPQFDKSQDERSELANWPTITLPVDIVLFEGWCVASQPQSDEALTAPINSLEASEDQDGQWRQYINQQLKGPYQELFCQLQSLVMLQIPSFDKVIEWRSLQEQKLRQQSDQQSQGVMDQQTLQRFIMHYERLTRANLAEMPQRADLLLKLNDQHQISEIIQRVAS